MALIRRSTVISGAVARVVVTQRTPTRGSEQGGQEHPPRNVTLVAGFLNLTRFANGYAEKISSAFPVPVWYVAWPLFGLHERPWIRRSARQPARSPLPIR